MKMTKMTLTMARSPYYIERDEKTNKENRQALHTDVSPEVFNDFMQYVENTGYVKANGDLNKSQALSEIVINFLNNNVFEQKFFRNLYAILLLPKTLNPDEINEKAQVIGFIEGNEYITLMNVFYGGGIDYPLRHNFMYTLREFNEDNYKGFLHYFNVMYPEDYTIFFNIDKKTQQDFESVKQRLSVLYPDNDIDDSYFVMFALNNYLDILKDGVYRSKHSRLEHEGVIVLLEDLYEGFYARLKWSYLQGEFSLDLQFDDVRNFKDEVSFDIGNAEILIDFDNITKIVSGVEGKLQFKRKQTVKEIAYLEGLLEKNRQELKEIDEELSQYDEDDS